MPAPVPPAVDAPDRSDVKPVTIRVPARYGSFGVPRFTADGQSRKGRDREFKGGDVITVPAWFAQETLGDDVEAYEAEKGDVVIDAFKDAKASSTSADAGERKGAPSPASAKASERATAEERAHGSGASTTKGTGPGGSTRTTRGSEA